MLGNDIDKGIFLPEGERPQSVLLKRLILVVVFLTLTPITLVASVYSLIALTNNSHTLKNKEGASAQTQGVQVYASLPSAFPSISGQIVEEDARADLVTNYLKKYDSPLEPYARFIVEVSDKYNLDYRLITAIAMKESGLCKIIPEQSYNCWGWGIHSRGTLKFDSFEEGIETVSKGLRENYVNKGLNSAEEIMSKYTPQSPGGAWAIGVSQFMDEMR